MINFLCQTLFVPKKYKSNHLGRIMKLSTFLLLSCAFTGIAGNVSSQNARVTLNENNVAVSKILNSIESQTDYLFIYNKNNVNVSRTASVKAKEKTVDKVLSELFNGTNITYEMEGKHIVLSMKKNTSEINSTAQSQQTGKTVTGVIKDKSGLEVIGANIVEKGTTNGTITDVNGQFTLTVQPGAILQVSFIGYNTKEIKVGNESTLNVILEEDSQALDEVVVVGYGAQKKVNLTGAITTVKMEDVVGNRPVGNTAQALEGAIPGLQVSRNNGKPGTTINMNVRGATSINDDTNGAPLVLVDNVPMDIDLLDPNDIESVTTLKDAAASAIYGARAAFGVILITTKQGKKDTPMRVSYNNNFSFSTPAALPNKVDPYTTVQTYANMGLKRYYGGQDTEQWLGYLDEYRNGQHKDGYVWSDGVRYNLAPTDVIDDMMDNFGFQQQHNVSVTGGSSKATYRVSFGMMDEDGILVTDKDSYKRYNASAFVSMDANKWLTLQADFRYTDSKTSTAQSGTSEHGENAVWSFASSMPSMCPLGYDYATEDDNELLPYGTPSNLLRLASPKINRANNTRILGRVMIKPLAGLDIIGEYSFNRNWGSEKQFNEIYKYIAPVTGEKKDTYTNSKYQMKQFFETTNAINIFATYSKDIDDHSFSVMGGYNQENWYYESLKATREDPINQGLPSISQSTGTITSEDSFKEYALRSLFYRLTYSYKGKYLEEANGLYDGSSRFPKNDRFGFFPSFSAGWRISEESFMEDTKDWLNNMKVRASWGSIGNQNVDYYAYLPTIDAKNDYNWILPGTDKYVTTLGVPGLVSSSFTWETVNTLDIGVDLNLFNRLGIVFDWYQRDTKDMLTAAKPLPAVLGANAPKVNAADMRSKGWELAVTWSDKIGKDIRYNIGLNLYDSRSKITKYSNDDNLLTYTDASDNNIEKMYYREGMEFGEIWGYTTDRFYTENDFVDGKLKDDIPVFLGQNRDNVKPGDILYKDFDGDGKISNGDNSENNPGDLRKIGNSTPRFQYGINAGISYKDFDLSLFFTGVGKRDLWISDLWAPNGQFVTSVFDYQTDYWQEDNLNAYYPRVYGEGGNNGYNNKRQTKYLKDGSYVRLKNLTVGYNLPADLCNKLYIQKLRVFFSGENLFTWHHLPEGYYPDSYSMAPGSNKVNANIEGDSKAAGWSYPLMRQFSFGINVTF